MTYKLSYFDARGLAEPIRLLFAYGGIEFEDIRAPMTGIPSALPIEIKEKCTWGQVPLLEFDGKKLVQSLAITRYVAKKVGLVPKDDFEAALCDEYVDTSRELLNCFIPLVMEKDEAKRNEKLAEIIKTVSEKYLSKFETILKENGGHRLVGKDLSWADIYLAHIFNQINTVNKMDILKSFPECNSFTNSVLQVPQLKAWIDKRPVTQF